MDPTIKSIDALGEQGCGGLGCYLQYRHAASGGGPIRRLRTAAKIANPPITSAGIASGRERATQGGRPRGTMQFAALIAEETRDGAELGEYARKGMRSRNKTTHRGGDRREAREVQEQPQVKAERAIGSRRRLVECMRAHRPRCASRGQSFLESPPAMPSQGRR